MGIKLKKSKKPLYIVAFVICVCSFLTSVVAIMGASTLNSYSVYMDPYFLESSGYGSFEEFLRDQDSGFLTQMSVINEHMKLWLIIAMAAGVLALIALIYLVIATGEKDESGAIVINRFDRIFSEFQLAAICVIFFAGGTAFTQFVDNVINSVYGLGYSMSSFELSFEVVLAVLLGVGAASLGLGLILSCIKKIKAGCFLEQSICGWIVNKLYREIYMGGSLMRKVVIAAVLICLLSATIFLAPVMLIMILVFAPKWVHRYDEVKKGIEEVNNGNLGYKIPVQGEDELGQLAEGINRISEATSIAVQNELRNQRMKTDLISNVSHDLKTPLTSMVTYIDLLKTEGLDSERAPEYLEILEQKTDRLRQLTEDLFEAAKASSGAIPVRMSRVDLLSLLNQGLGELNERVEESNLDFIIEAPEARYFVKADGQLLWRVISNLLSNVLKYSQEHTRVYISFSSHKTDSEERVVMEIKNISRQSLNINPSELMERFKRGDESRSTEGSGLGLAIAKDLMKLMGGWIDIAIDGDLFKAKVMLSAAAEDEPAAVDLEDEPEDLKSGDIGFTEGAGDPYEEQENKIVDS